MGKVQLGIKLNYWHERQRCSPSQLPTGNDVFTVIYEKWKTKNEKREMKNEKQKTKNENWKTKNEKWKTKNEIWKMKNKNEKQKI